MYNTIHTAFKGGVKDVKGGEIRHNAQSQLSIETGDVKSTKLFSINYNLTEEQLKEYGNKCIKDTVTDNIFFNEIAIPEGYKSFIAIAKLPGVTDDEGASTQMALADFLNVKVENHQQIFSQYIYYFEQELSSDELNAIAKAFLGNPLINHISYGNTADEFKPFVPNVKLTADNTTGYIDLEELSDDQLLQLSQDMVLALNLEEMHAVRDYYRREDIQAIRKEKGLDARPTDCELEVLAQTWSEHCKHKEFSAVINYKNEETGEEKQINSLFKTYIQGATSVVSSHLDEKKNDWLVKVFSDNAGVVKATKDQLFIWKVETHNSPSALDPYGGAITGILGVNRDVMGTGVGGARLLFNTDVLCFGPPNYSKPLLKGQLHPRRIMEGVVEGVQDGGNKSGVPTVNGSIIFDDRYAGKPLVYCGTGGLMPYQFAGKDSWEKPIDAGDRIIMAGGRIGKDGIHGATFSSVEIDENSPMSAVQIGSPITQKKLMDFMIKAAEQGLIKTSTDNGAGGLSSSIGELAEIPNGAVVNLEQAPLKYAGLRPWEIFVSESQERMTLVVDESQMEALFQLGEDMEVELSDVGYFTNDGFLDVRYNNEHIAYLDLEFLHDGVPQKKMVAEWKELGLKEPGIADADNYNEALTQLLNSYNIRSRESVIRRYDHEVKGRSVIKPLMGSNGKASQDAAVVRLGFETNEGIAVSNGITPKYGDIDAYEMSKGAFDEGIRQIIAVGGKLPNLHEGDDTFWSANDNFCVPDSFYTPEGNPDGKEKLAKLVQMCEGLYEMSTFFDVPMTSGKDSMKNDLKSEGVKISVPPTILYSMAAKIQDITKTVTADFKVAGDLIYQIGETYDELGASEFYKLHNELGANVPKVRKEAAKELYLKVMEANKDGLIESNHDLSDGGLAVAVAECAIGSQLGATINLDGLNSLSNNAKMFAESHSRFVATVKPENKAAFEAIMGDRATLLGEVTSNDNLVITSNNATIVDAKVADLTTAWSEDLL